MHRSATTTTPRRAARSAPLFLALALAWLAWGATPARAQLIMGITTNSFTPGSSNNSLDVSLTNTGNSDVAIGGFSFDIVANNSNVTFSDVTVNTLSVGYIFAGNSALGPDLTPTGQPGNYGQEISGGDTFAQQNGGITLHSGETLGLGNVMFALSMTNGSTPVGITFTAFPASGLNDPGGNDISSMLGFAPHPPQIGPTSVPELPPAALVVTGLLLGGGVQIRRLGLARFLTRLRLRSR